MLEENYIKRERLRKEEAKKRVEEMREALPVYTLDQIRQHRLPFHEALLDKLEDSGYVFTAHYVRKLFKIQEDIRQKAGPLSHMWMRPELYSSKVELKALCDLLTKSEDYRKAGNRAMECEIFLQTAAHFAFSNEDWWWLGEELLLHSLALSTEYKFLGGKYEALNRYLYGKFLINNFHQYENAMYHLKIARELSNGNEWTTKLIVPSGGDVLFLQVNFLLYTCLISQVEILMKTEDGDYEKAGRLAVIAKKRATEACYHEGVIRALLLKGICELSCNDPKGAIQTFTKAFYIQVKIGDGKGICETRIQLAKAYLLDGNAQLSLNTLLLLRESAEDFKLPYYLAQAYRHLGEFFLNSGEAEKATPLLGEAFKIFHDCGYIPESEQVRNLEAISTGLELFPKYLAILSRSNKSKYLKKLIDWKETRTSFIEDDESLGSYSLQDVIKESMSEMEESMSECLEEQEEEQDEEEEEEYDEDELMENNDDAVVQLHAHEDSVKQESTTGLADVEKKNG